MADSPAVDDPQSEAQNQRDWFTLLRRAFGVPDVVGTGTARRAILDQFEEHIREAEKVDLGDKPGELEGRTLDAVVEAGAKGSFDMLIAGLPVKSDDPRDKTAHAIVDLSGWSGALEAIRDLIWFSVDRVAAFVQAHPFKDECGRYFS
jgi:hypothetical protein